MIYIKILDEFQPLYFIAEAGINHNGSVGNAFKLIDVAKKVKANAVKFQTFVPEALVSIKAPMATYQKENTGENGSQLKMLQNAHLPHGSHHKLVSHCRKQQIDFLSTPFEEDSADFLESLGLDVFKIPSGEITNTPFLRHIGRMKKTVILSTGMSNLAEVKSQLKHLKTTDLPE